MLGPGRPTVEQLRVAKREAQRRFAGHDDVAGVGIGDGCLRVYVRAHPATHDLPDEVDGVRVERIEVGTISVQPSDG